MKVGFPIWGDRISPVLDTALRLLVIETDGEKKASRFETYLDVQDLPTRCFRIRGLGVDTLICGAVSQHFVRRLKASGIQIIPGISGPSEDVVEAYFKGNLSDPRFLMPGYTGVEKNR